MDTFNQQRVDAVDDSELRTFALKLLDDLDKCYDELAKCRDACGNFDETDLALEAIGDPFMVGARVVEAISDLNSQLTQLEAQMVALAYESTMRKMAEATNARLLSENAELRAELEELKHG